MFTTQNDSNGSKPAPSNRVVILPLPFYEAGHPLRHFYALRLS